jgi:hypothetical protein
VRTVRLAWKGFSQTGQVRVSVRASREAVRHSGEQNMRFGLRVVVNSCWHWGQVRWVGRCERAISRQVGEQ